MNLPKVKVTQKGDYCKTLQREKITKPDMRLKPTKIKGILFWQTEIHKFKTMQKHLHKQGILLITIATKKSNNVKLQILQNMT